MWLNMLAVKYYHYFFCSHVSWKYYGNLHSKLKLILFVLLEMNCKINSLGVLKSLSLYINDIMERSYIKKIH